MGMTNIDQFNRKECDKIDSNCINAYLDFELDPDSATGICLHSSWGGACLDLTGIVKAAETVTRLYLSPEGEPTCLVFEREDGQSDCITGDELSRIISMTKLKDVDQGSQPRNGDVYMYNNGKWYPFNLQQYIDDTTMQINNLSAAVTQLRNLITPVVNRFEEFEGVPANAKIVLGVINAYGDTNATIDGGGTATSLDKTHGLYSHSLNNDILDDLVFG